METLLNFDNSTQTTRKQFSCLIQFNKFSLLCPSYCVRDCRQVPTSVHPHLPSSIHLHPAHFTLDPALCNTLNIIRTKISHLIGQFPQIHAKNSKLSVLTENWHTWYFGDADSRWSGLRFLKFQPRNQFLGRFGQRKSKLSVSPENWDTCYLKDADS